MGIGIVSITTSQKKEQSGPPFSSNSANNGLSVDASSGAIVLGNDVGDPLVPAILLSNREIATQDAVGTNLFSVSLNDLFNAINTALNGGNITIADAAGISQIIADVNAGGLTAARMFIQTNTVKWKVQSSTTDVTITSGSANIGVMRFQNVSPFGVHFHSNSGNAYNSATVQISGTTTFRRFTQSTGVNVSIDRDLDSGKLWRNSAAVNLTLPNMAGANSRPGFILGACCNNVAGLTITATALVIRFGSLVTSNGGTLSSTDVGACVTIVYDGTQWITESFCGAWSLT
jgi:hypothetical protein